VFRLRLRPCVSGGMTFDGSTWGDLPDGFAFAPACFGFAFAPTCLGDDLRRQQI
jgi:hypothetical protein